MRWAFVILLVSTPAFAEDVKIGANVLVWADAKWFVDADEKSPSVQLSTDARTLHRVVPAKLVTISKDFYEVELQKANDCAWANATTPNLVSTRLFVKRDALAPVLAKPFRATYPDGSRIALSPGVPVIKGAGDAFKISILGDEVDVDIPAASVAFSYTSPKLPPFKPAPDANTMYTVRTGSDAALGKHAVKVANHEAARVTKRAGKASLFPLAAPCIAATVAVPADDVIANKGNLGRGIAGLLAAEPMQKIQEHWYIAKGEPMLSPAGRVVGRAAKQFVFYELKAPNDKQVCHDFVVDLRSTVDTAPAIKETDAAARAVSLCVPKEKLKHVNPMPARASKGK